MAKHWQVSFLEHYHAKREKEHKREEKRKKGKRYQDVRFPEYHHTKKKEGKRHQQASFSEYYHAKKRKGKVRSGKMLDLKLDPKATKVEF